MKKIETAPFDAADYLDDEETIAEYLTAALEDPNPDLFLVAVRDVARARGKHENHCKQRKLYIEKPAPAS